jgi:hypothetical protein
MHMPTDNLWHRSHAGVLILDIRSPERDSTRIHSLNDLKRHSGLSEREDSTTLQGTQHGRIGI